MVVAIIGMLAAGIAVIFTAGRTDFFLSGPTPAERIAATVAASPAEEDPSALDVSLADVRAENSHADSPAATDAGKARKRLDLAEVQAALRALDDAPRGADTERRERELVDRWSELDPAGAAAWAGPLADPKFALVVVSSSFVWLENAGFSTSHRKNRVSCSLIVAGFTSTFFLVLM